MLPNLYCFNCLIGALVVSTYVNCPDIRKIVTPDLKVPAMGESGVLLFVDLSNDNNRLGGTAFAQCFKQLGKNVPDINDAEELKNAFVATQVR